MDDVDDVEMVDDRQEHYQTLVFVVRRQSSLSHFFVFFVVEVDDFDYFYFFFPFFDVVVFSDDRL